VRDTSPQGFAQHLSGLLILHNFLAPLAGSSVMMLRMRAGDPFINDLFVKSPNPPDTNGRDFALLGQFTNG
jgi:hypothetical protein